MTLAAIVGVDGAGLLSSVTPMLERETRTGAKLGFDSPTGSSSAKPVGMSARAPGVKLDAAHSRHAGHHIETGGMLGVIGGKRQAFAMRQAQHGGRRPRHSAAERRARRASLARASSRAAVSSLLMRRPILDAGRRDQMHLRLVAAHGASPGPHVVGHDPIGALGAALGGGVGDQILGLGGEADDEARTLWSRPGDGREDVRVLGRASAPSRPGPAS